MPRDPRPAEWKMDKDLGLLLLLLLLCHKGNAHSCPYNCQCFSSVLILCADERMASLPRNMSKQVKDFIIIKSAVSYLFPCTLEESPQLTRLIFMNNALRSVHSLAFHNLTELQELEISGNPWLDRLNPGTFSKQANLTKLLLNFNSFRTVLPGMFDSLKQLETLQMKGNIMSDLPPFLFLNLQNLHVLDLSQNKLADVKRETFTGPAKLDILKLNNNLISNLSLDVFNDVSQLTELHLEGNKISGLADGVFSALTKLKVLNLRGNHLTTFGDRVFGLGPSDLRELNLKGNRLTELTSLGALTSLTDAILSSNRLSDLKEDTFRNVTSLENLDLSDNQLTLLPERTFSDLHRIKAIHLQQNNLSKVSAKLFEDQTLIQQLYLSDNRLETLPRGLLDVFVLQHTIRLHGNPWRCDCQMRHLHDWVLANSRDVEMLDSVLCASPGFLRGRPVASVDRNQLACGTSEDGALEASGCSLQASGDTVVIKCKVDKCSPLTVTVQFDEEDGSTTEQSVKNEPKCSNDTTLV